MLGPLFFLFAFVHALKEVSVGSLTQQHRNRLLRFCNNEESMHILSEVPRQKLHQVRTMEVQQQTENFVICWATSTKLGVRKRDKYLVKLSVDTIRLRTIADKLKALENVPNVQRCRWDCTVGVVGMQVPIRRVIDRRRRKKRTIWGRWNFFALPLQHVPGERVGDYLRKISQDIPPLPATSRKSLMQDQAIKSLYAQLFDAAKIFWKAGWVHKDMTVGNVVRDDSGTITFIELDSATRKHHKMDRRDIMNWMVAIATDFVYLGYSFALMIVCPEEARGRFGVYNLRRDCISYQETWDFVSEQDEDLRKMLAFKNTPPGQQKLEMLPIEFAILAREFWEQDNPEDPHFEAPPTYQSIMGDYLSNLGPSISEMLPSIARETNRALSPPPENAPSTDSPDNVPTFYGNIAPGDEDRELPSFLPKSWGKQRMKPIYRDGGQSAGIPIQIEIDPISGAGSSQAHSELGSAGSASGTQAHFDLGSAGSGAGTQSVSQIHQASSAASTHVHSELADSQILPLQDSENGSVDIPSEEVQSDSSGTVNELADAFDDMQYPIEYRPQELSSTKKKKNNLFVVLCGFVFLLAMFTLSRHYESTETQLTLYSDLLLQEDDF